MSLPSLRDMQTVRASDLRDVMPKTAVSRLMVGGSVMAVTMAASVLASGLPGTPEVRTAVFSEASNHLGPPHSLSPLPKVKTQLAPIGSGLAEATLPSTTLTSAMPFRYSGSSGDRNRATECLAAAAWYESGNDLVGQRAVAQTVINRVNHPSFPNSVCGVVFQGSDRKTGCQFTFTCDGSLHRRRPSASSWKSALAVADMALAGYVDTSVGTATHYHADYVSPWWSSSLQRLSKVGPHIFYRWAGHRGAFQKQIQLDAEQSLTRLSQKTHVAPPEFSDEAAPTIEYVSDNFAVASTAVTAPGVAEPITPPSASIVLALDPGLASGRWAISAMKACQGKTDCQVLGYSDPQAAQFNRSRSSAARERPNFLFLRDAGSGMDIALWDCSKTQRPNASQCLPNGAAALQKLMADRS